MSVSDDIQDLADLCYNHCEEEKNKLRKRRLFIWGIISAVLFVIIANPVAFSFVQKALNFTNLRIVDSSGNPTLIGLLIHSTVYTVIMMSIVSV